MEGKTTLAKIKEKYPFENTDLANLAEVNLLVIERMLEGKPVAHWQAVEVLKALSLVTKLTLIRKFDVENERSRKQQRSR